MYGISGWAYRRIAMQRQCRVGQGGWGNGTQGGVRMKRDIVGSEYDGRSGVIVVESSDASPVLGETFETIPSMLMRNLIVVHVEI